MKKFIAKIAKKHKYNRTRLLDLFWDIQSEYRYVSDEALELLSAELSVSVPELKDTLTFYHFFHDQPAGDYRIYLDKSVVAKMYGAKEVREAFEDALGIKVGETTPDGRIGLFSTACIGMSDQAPAALIAGVPVGKLTPYKAKKIAENLKNGIVTEHNVKNEIRREGPVFFGDYTFGESLQLAKKMKPAEIIQEVTRSNLRGRGGAGFTTGLKWKLCAAQTEKVKYVVCNADEGEPGTFKDRFLLTERIPMLIEGMAIAARAIGAKEGIIYLRAEYHYLLKNIKRNIKKCSVKDFSLRVQMGAGAYVVGEETALLESLEGKRGEPRVRPPFPVEKGYLGKPTIVNNVETFCSVVKIIKYGSGWYSSLGTKQSTGTKLLSVSGDCERPGIYEVEWGLTIADFLQMVGAQGPQAIQVGGPSGVCINPKDSQRVIGFEDLPTGGSMIVIGQNRDLLNIVRDFTKFFVSESCGCCAPCRAGSIVLHEQIENILNQDAAQSDLENIKNWSKVITASSRCGLGQTCSNPLTSTLNNFPELYQAMIGKEKQQHSFDLDSKLKEYNEFVIKYE